MSPRLRTGGNLAILIGAWEIAGRLRLVADGALPAPTAVLARFWEDRGDYAPHVLSTLQTASAGFVIGNLLAVAAAVLFVLVPRSERIARGLNIAIFALPPIAIVPILVTALPGITPRIVLAALAVYFPTMTAAVLGLSRVDPRIRDVIAAYGGGARSLFRLVRLRSAVPVLLAGLRVAAPNAVLGSILAEFGGGGRWGLGVYLLGSLGRADPPRLWGIGLCATAIAGIAYAAFALLGRATLTTSRDVTLAARALPPSRAADGWPWAVTALILPFAVWWLVLAALGTNPIVAKTPLGVAEYLIWSPVAGSAWARLLAALAETLPLTFLGMAAGLALALALAVLGEIRPTLARTLLPISLVTQTMPLVALTPLLVLMLGRGTAVTLAITVSVTFFPAFVTIAQGLQMVPRAGFELVRAYGGGAARELWLVALPTSLPYLFAAARLAVPRALLGVMIAEWLATGRGLGNLLNQSRGYLDYGMIWAVALVSVAISILFYRIVQAIETRVLARMRLQAE